MRAAYAEGRFVEAAELGAALKTSESYALAAQSLAMQGYFFAGQEEKKVLFQRGIELAEEAVRLNAANPEAHIQLAHTRGRYGQAIGFLQAVAGGYATRVRDSVEEALRLDPDMPGAHLSMATWHAEIVNAAGGMAGFLYGATAEKARGHYDRTIELMPDAKVACVEYAFGLLLMDGERNREEARRLLQLAIGKSANDAVDRPLPRAGGGAAGRLGRRLAAVPHGSGLILLTQLRATPGRPPRFPHRPGDPRPRTEDIEAVDGFRFVRRVYTS